MAKSFPADAAKTNLDQGTDDPKQARTDLVALVDKFNALKAALAPLAAMTVGTGLTVTDNGAGNADTLNAAAAESFVTGDGVLTINPTAPAGWVMANDGTIGNAASSATTRANADTEALFTLIWNQISNTWAPVSGGARGASAAADFAANRTIKLGSNLGRALAVAGAGAGLTARARGESLGEEVHALNAAETGPHAHGSGSLAADGASVGALNVKGSLDATGSVNRVQMTTSGNASSPIQDTSGPVLAGGSHGHPVSGATANAGSGTPHNTMQPTSFMWNVKIKL